MIAHQSKPVSLILRVMIVSTLVFGFSPQFIQFASSAPGDTVTLNVDTTTDDGTLSACVDGTPLDCSLRGAINHANGDIANSFIIAIPDGIYLLNYNSVSATEDANASGDLDIIHPNVTLQGTSQSATILDGNLTDRVIDHLYYESTLSINDLRIRNGKLASGEGGGGGIRVSGHNLFTSNRVTISDNIVGGSTTSDVGGGIYGGPGASLTIEESLIQHNDAYKGGGISTNNNTLTIIDSTIATNYATNLGGGVAIWNGGTSQIERTLFIGNESGLGGGFFNSSASLTVVDSTFQDNVSNSTGGGLELNGTSYLTNVTLYNNDSENGAGGIALRDSASASLTNVTLVGNTAHDGFGGGIFAFPLSTLSLNHVTFSGNNASATGKAIYAGTNSTISTVSSIFSSAVAGQTCKIEPTASWTTSFYNLSSDTSCNLIAGFDLINTIPLFGTFGDHGGPTFTLPLLRQSPAIDHGKPGDPAGRLDQRGVPIMDGDGNGSLLSDIGAFEYIPPSLWLPVVIRPMTYLLKSYCHLNIELITDHAKEKKRNTSK